MNPFVNPNKRSVLLPAGCNDLVDILNGPKNRDGLQAPTRRQAPPRSDAITSIDKSVVERFVHLILQLAQEDEATTLVIEPISETQGTGIKLLVKDVWYRLTPFPSHIRPAVVAELARMAGLDPEQFPTEDVMFTTGPNPFKWRVSVEGPAGECVLTRLPT